MSGLNLPNKRHYPVFIRANTDITFPQSVIHGVITYQAPYEKKLTIANLSILSGMSQPTVGSAVSELKQAGLITKGYQPVWDTSDKYFLTKHNYKEKKGGDRYLFFIYYPPSPKSPLNVFQHGMYCFLAGTTIQIVHVKEYVISQLKLAPKTVAEAKEALEGQQLMQGQTLYPPDDEQLDFFQNAGQILKDKKEPFKIATEPLSVIKKRKAASNGRAGKVAAILKRDVDSNIEAFCNKHSSLSDDEFRRLLKLLEEQHLKGKADWLLTQ